MTRDISAYLAGYVKGYWEGYDYFLDNGEDNTATGSADSSPPSPRVDPGKQACSPKRFAGEFPGSTRSEDESLPAIRQLAASMTGMDITLADGWMLMGDNNNLANPQNAMSVLLLAMAVEFRRAGRDHSAQICYDALTIIQGRG